MKIPRRFTKPNADALNSVEYEKRTSRITNPDGSVVFEMNDAEIPKAWSQLATDIMVSKYFRKAGVPQTDSDGQPVRDAQGNVVTGPEKSAKQVVNRLAGCWRYWGEKHGYFDSAQDAQTFYDELAYMLLHQMCAPNSPQWFNTGLNFAYGITGPSQGHYYCDPRTGEMMRSQDAYSHPQPHACFIQSVSDDLVNSGGIMDLWTREARLFKYGSGTGTNFSKLRGDDEPLSGGGKSSGLMSFLKIGDRAAGAIKSGGTTRRAAKMVCLDLDHPDIEEFVNWKVREEIKVAAMVAGLKNLPKDQQKIAERIGLELDFDFNGEAYATVSGQNSNNSVRVPNKFFEAVDGDGAWPLYWRTNKQLARTVKARDLWDQIAFAAWRCADPGVQYDDTINQWHTCPRSGRINASNPCVTGDTRVLTPGGIWRRIDQMIHLPSRLVTNLAGQEIHATEGSFPTGVREVFELRTAGGYTLKLTADHKVWTRSRGWVEARSLLSGPEGDEVKFPSQPACVEQIGEPQDPQFFQLAGLFVSQANNDATAVRLDACLAGCPHADQLAQYAAENWMAHAYPDDYVNTSMMDADDGDTLTMRLGNRRLISRLRAFVRTDGPARRLAEDIFTAGLAAQKHVLRGLFTADGRFSETGDTGSLEMAGESRGLLEDVQLLLLGFAVQSQVRDTRPGHAVLTILPRCLSAFASHIGLISDDKNAELNRRCALIGTPSTTNFDRVASLRPLGPQQVFDLTEPATRSFIANGLCIHNCSEYMFLDDTACNLASLNVLTFYDAESRTFDIEAYKHAIRIWTVVLEISVLMASFPSQEIARLSYKFRTLGLGYANLGAMLMQAGIPYDGAQGRAICAALTAILTGESYATSADMARELGTFPGYEENKTDMLRVIRNHRRASGNVAHTATTRSRMGDYEGLDIKPVGIDASEFGRHPLASPALLAAAQECWDRALALGEHHGYRNAQTTVIAPTGTIGLLMDCDTTGVEPDFALVKFKKLAGGGVFKIANQSLQPALTSLGYANREVNEILRYVLGTLTLHDAPHINWESLKLLGFTDAELQKIEQSLPSTFEIGFAFNPWSLSPETMKRFNVSEADWAKPGFSLLRTLGFTRKQIEQANDIICGTGTVEGAPHLKVEHLPVFDCANRCGRHGTRFIAADGHIRMMASAQPFISGAISKTINLPNEATVEEIQRSYRLSWELGLKANALYRDGSKLSQPLSGKSDETEEETIVAEEEPGVSAVRDELNRLRPSADELAAMVAKVASRGPASDNLAPAPMGPVEKIIERIVERPLRRRLPDTRHALTHKFDVGGHEGYITTGLYEDGQPGEVFITMAKEGSTVGGLMDTVATLVSVALQYGVPVESLVKKFEHVRFEPSGMTRNQEIPFAKSLVDYIFRWLGMEFIPGYRAANAPHRTPAAPTPESAAAATEAPAAAPTADAPRSGNGHGPRKSETEPTVALRPAVGLRAGADLSVRLVMAVDPLSQQGAELQTDAPACDVCGSITVRSGTCYKCLNCGNSMGCS